MFQTTWQHDSNTVKQKQIIVSCFENWKQKQTNNNIVSKIDKNNKICFPTTDATEKSGLAAIKLTALGKPQLLVGLFNISMPDA